MPRYKKKNIVYKLLKQGNSLIEKYVKDTRKLLTIILLTTVFLFILVRYKQLFFTLLLILLGAVSLIHSRYFKYSHYIGFELCLMATVLTSLAYGPVYGMVTGFTSITLGFILSGYFKPTYFISVLTMPLIGLLVPFFSNHLSLPYLGLLMTLIYDAIILPLYVLVGGSRIPSASIFFVTHVLLNIWIFSTIAPIILRLMT